MDDATEVQDVMIVRLAAPNDAQCQQQQQQHDAATPQERREEEGKATSSNSRKCRICSKK
jgi:hypothetical protein